MSTCKRSLIAPDDTIAIGPDEGRLVVQHLRPVDVSPPETSITAGPTGLISDSTPAFSFSSSEQNSTLECRLDSNQEADFLPCSSPHTLSLADGPHTFNVRAIDRADNPDPSPAQRNFTVDTTPPAKTTGRRAAALKKCKKKRGKRRQKCIKRAKKLPV